MPTQSLPLGRTISAIKETKNICISAVTASTTQVVLKNVRKLDDSKRTCMQHSEQDFELLIVTLLYVTYVWNLDDSKRTCVG